MSAQPYRLRDALLAVVLIGVSWLAVIGAASLLLGKWR